MRTFPFLYAVLVVLPAAPPPPSTLPSQSSPRPHMAPDSNPTEPDPLVTEIQRVGETATRVALAIGDDGSVLSCTITEASASPTLDIEACRILTARARFAPPGNEDPRTRSQRIVWRIED